MGKGISQIQFQKMLLLRFEFTDHCSVQIGGDVEDFVQTHGRVDAFVLFASAKESHTYKQIHTGITHTQREREEMSTLKVSE